MDDAFDATTKARQMWHVLEPIHAVTYFAPECHDAYRALGLKGFWMGYFASRSAPFGEASADLVSATFFNFRPTMVARALPDAWSLASPCDVLAARRSGAVAALRRLLGESGGTVDPTNAVGEDRKFGASDSVRVGAEPFEKRIEEAASLAEDAVEGCELGGRPLFGALRALGAPTDPLGRLWHAATLLREHRGDGHVAANLAHGLDGLTTHVTFAAGGSAVGRADLQPHRGWTDEEWTAAETALLERGWLDQDGALTPEGRRSRAAVERLTDELAAGPWLALGPQRTARLRALLAPLTRAIVTGGGIPANNPMGVPTVAIPPT